MQPYNATDAIFYGFRLFKRDPILIAALTVVFAAFTFVMAQFTWSEMAAFMTTMMQTSAGAPETADPQALMDEMREAYVSFFTAPSMLLYLALSIIVGLVIQGAVLRQLVRDERGGWVMGMQFGMDEVRLLVVGVIIFVITFVASVVLFGIVGLLAGMLAMANPALSVLVGLIGGLAALLALMLLGVRFALAAPASIGERKFVVLGSWALTKNRYWGLLGAYVVLFFIALVIFIAIGLIAGLLSPTASGFTQGMGGGEAVEITAADFRSPGYALSVLLSSAANVIVAAAWSGVGAYAYRMLGAARGYPGAAPVTTS